MPVLLCTAVCTAMQVPGRQEPLLAARRGPLAATGAAAGQPSPVASSCSTGMQHCDALPLAWWMLSRQDSRLAIACKMLQALCKCTHWASMTNLQIEELREAFEEKLSQMESQLEGHEGPFLLG